MRKNVFSKLFYSKVFLFFFVGENNEEGVRERQRERGEGDGGYGRKDIKQNREKMEIARERERPVSFQNIGKPEIEKRKLIKK